MEVTPRKPSELQEGEFFTLKLDGLQVICAKDYGMVTIFLPSVPDGTRGIHIYNGDPGNAVAPDPNLSQADAIYKTVQESIAAQ